MMIYRLANDEELTENKLMEFMKALEKENRDRYLNLEKAYKTDYNIKYEKKSLNGNLTTEYRSILPNISLTR